MIELVRIVEQQATLSSYKATQNEARALQLELLIEMTKPNSDLSQWHALIATPFRYSPPHPQARFRPPYGRNVFYGALLEETALYEHAYYFMKQRMHLKMTTQTGMRTIFFVAANDTDAFLIKQSELCAQITDKNDYAMSQQFVMTHPEITFIIYPSCRDPKARDNVAILDIHHLAKNPNWESAIKFFYDNKQQQITWLDYHLHIPWQAVF